MNEGQTEESAFGFESKPRKGGEICKQKFSPQGRDNFDPAMVGDPIMFKTDICFTLLFSYRCGSVIVDLTLSFSAIVTEKRILNILQDVAKDGTLGNFNVDASSIKGTRADILVATRPAIGKTTPKLRDGTILSKKCFLLT